ncbi:olfactory receptor 14A16-like, partial [Agelaius tricolor]|uniref:olfactory receptor 14A16-like n=1 Tax=Agelaius tricolor TaxID=9191 RepID=UPI0039F1E47D
GNGLIISAVACGHHLHTPMFFFLLNLALAILKLSCSKSYLREFGLIAVSVCLDFVCFVFIVFSYVQIFRAVLRIPSEQGRHKAFSTCLPHLAVLSLFFSTGASLYLKPP